MSHENAIIVMLSKHPFLTTESSIHIYDAKKKNLSNGWTGLLSTVLTCRVGRDRLSTWQCIRCLFAIRLSACLLFLLNFASSPACNKRRHCTSLLFFTSVRTNGAVWRIQNFPNMTFANSRMLGG